MAELKTKENGGADGARDGGAFLNTVENEAKRADSFAIS